MQEYEEAIVEIGKVGAYQVFLYFILGFFSLRICFTVIIFLFMMGEMPFTCDWPATLNATGLFTHQQLYEALQSIAPIDWTALNSSTEHVNISYIVNNPSIPQCSLRLDGIYNSSIAQGNEFKCSKWIFEHTYYGKSLFEEFELVCDRYYLVNACQGTLWIGMVLGIFIGALADKYGRRPVILGCCVTELLASVLTIFSTNIWMFMVLRCVSGIVQAALKLPFILFQEIIHTRYRGMMGNLWWLKWVAGYCISPLAGLILRDWKSMAILGFCLNLLFISYYWWVPESPRWLLLNGRVKEAQAEVDKICKWNKVQTLDLNQVYVQTDKHPGRFWHLLTSPYLRLKTLTLLFMWFVNSLLFYGFTLNESVAFNNVYLSVAVMGLSEVPGYVLAWLLSEALGRRLSTFVTLLICAAALVPAPFLRELWYMRFALAFIGKIACTASFSIVILYSSELYNTGLRGTAVNIGNSLSRFSGVLAPVINKMTGVPIFVPSFIYALFAVACALCCFLLPETKDRSMPQTRQDADMQYNDTWLTKCCLPALRVRPSKPEEIEVGECLTSETKA